MSNGTVMQRYAGLASVVMFTGLITFLGQAVAANTDSSGDTLTLTELRAERTKMAQRRRRIIFNNDGDDIGGHPDDHITKRTKENERIARTPEGLLKMRTTALLGSQVDSIFYHSALGMKLHHGSGPFGQLYAAPDITGAYLRNRINLLVNYGQDALDVMIEFCRKNDLEIFYSNRMNDAHDYYIPGIMYYLRVRHPEYTIGYANNGKSPQETLKDLLHTRTAYSGYNFGLEVIRDLTVDAMREVCQTYDIDGIELDYFRSPYLVPMPVDAREIEQLNDMMRKMRTMTEEEGLRRGRPILIAARYIVNLERSLYYGLDVKTWLEEGLVDLLTGAHNGSQRRPVKAMFDLAHRYGVACYPIVQCNSKDGSNGLGEHDWNVWRADALSCFAQGADGITTFNSFEPNLPMWWELGDPEQLMLMDKTYVWDFLPSSGNSREVPPVTVTEEGSEPIPLYIGDDFGVAPPNGKTRNLKLRIHQTWQENNPAAITETVPGHTVIIKLNGNTLRETKLLPDVEHLQNTSTIVALSQAWQFKTDPDDQGISGQWFLRHIDDIGWITVRSDKGSGWERQGFSGYTGYGWYRTQLPHLPEQLRKFTYIHFSAIDEQAWVYLNGDLIAMHTIESTGLRLNQIWTQPFGVDVSNLLGREDPNVLAVRIHNAEAMGGIWKPVHLVSSDVPINKKQQHAVVKQLTPGAQSAWLDFMPPAELFKQGENFVESRLSAPSSDTVKIDDVRLEVRYVD